MREDRRDIALKANDLGDLQILVLRALWTLGEGTVYEVLGAITREPAPAYTTVLTVLRSLEKRGLLAHRLPPGERQYRYCPLVGEAEAERSVVCDVLERLFDGSAERLVARLLESDGLSQEEITRLRRAVDRALYPPGQEPSPLSPAFGTARLPTENRAEPPNQDARDTNLTERRKAIAGRLRNRV